LYVKIRKELICKDSNLAEGTLALERRLSEFHISSKSCFPNVTSYIEKKCPSRIIDEIRKLKLERAKALSL